ncbi:hypothetical protein DFH27DRAFT_570445 [Peziza echinospora]|nr:hypothetical protein DFH27DRAFT_570445 [Peziza echinospora]
MASNIPIPTIIIPTPVFTFSVPTLSLPFTIPTLSLPILTIPSISLPLPGITTTARTSTTSTPRPTTSGQITTSTSTRSTQRSTSGPSNTLLGPLTTTLQTTNGPTPTLGPGTSDNTETKSPGTVSTQKIVIIVLASIVGIILILLGLYLFIRHRRSVAKAAAKSDTERNPAGFTLMHESISDKGGPVSTYPEFRNRQGVTSEVRSAAAGSGQDLGNMGTNGYELWDTSAPRYELEQGGTTAGSGGPRTTIENIHRGPTNHPIQPNTEKDPTNHHLRAELE